MGPQEGAVRGVEEKGVVRGAVMGEELQAKQQASTSARTSCGIYEYILPVRRQRTQLLIAGATHNTANCCSMQASSGEHSSDIQAECHFEMCLKGKIQAVVVCAACIVHACPRL